MRSSFRKLTAASLAVLLTLALTGGSALAFECYNASRSAQGNTSASQSNGFFTVTDALVGFCGVDPADVPAIIEDLEGMGYRSDILINAHALMAAGLEFNGSPNAEELLSNGLGIDHLSDQFFADLAGVLVEHGYSEDACE